MIKRILFSVFPFSHKWKKKQRKPAKEIDVSKIKASRTATDGIDKGNGTLTRNTTNATTEIKSQPQQQQHNQIEFSMQTIPSEHTKGSSDEVRTTQASMEDTRGNSFSDNETIDGPISNLQISNPSLVVKEKTKEVISKRATEDDDYESVRIVFLGPCNTGKSTLVKQLQNLFLNGPTHEKVEIYRHLIIDNTLQSVKSVLTYMKKQNIPFEDVKHEKTMETILGVYDSNSIHVAFDSENNLSDKFVSMFNDPGFQRALDDGTKYNLLESARYFMEHFRQIFEAEYDPTREDMLRSRESTIAVSREVVPVDKGLPIKIQDFGGYRFQRMKWYSYFTATIDCIVYVHSLASYNLSVEEDSTANELAESLQVFEDIANHEVLKHLPLILVLNKKDLFMEKLPVEPFVNTWHEYKGENKSLYVMDYIKNKFISLNKTKNRPFYVYFTTAILPDQASALLKTIVKVAQKSHDEKTFRSRIEKDDQ